MRTTEQKLTGLDTIPNLFVEVRDWSYQYLKASVAKQGFVHLRINDDPRCLTYTGLQFKAGQHIFDIGTYDKPELIVVKSHHIDRMFIRMTFCTYDLHVIKDEDDLAVAQYIYNYSAPFNAYPWARDYFDVLGVLIQQYMESGL